MAFDKATKVSAATGNYPIALQLLPSVKDATLCSHSARPAAPSKSAIGGWEA